MLRAPRPRRLQTTGRAPFEYCRHRAVCRGVDRGTRAWGRTACSARRIRAATQPREAIEEVTRRWETALSDHDAEALASLYAPDAVLESPLVPHILGTNSGVVRGRDELLPFFEKVVSRTPHR
jgi:hypothetical protein